MAQDACQCNDAAHGRQTDADHETSHVVCIALVLVKSQMQDSSGAQQLMLTLCVLGAGLTIDAQASAVSSHRCQRSCICNALCACAHMHVQLPPELLL